MKKITTILLSMLFVGMISSTAFAQDTEEISDDALWRYALLQEVVNQMKKDISVELNGLIKAQDGMTGQRYKELAATKGDADKLAAIEAKDWEVQFLEVTEKMKKERTDAIKSVNQDLATKMVGNKGKTYKAVKAALGSDAELKAKYDGMVAAIRMENVDKADD